MLGILLTDDDVGKVPLLRTDQYGNFIPDPATGFAQVITGIGLDGIPNTADDIVISGTPAAPVGLTTAIRTNHAFLADIAHNAVPGGVADGDITIGLENPGNQPGVYDNELLDAHFIAGDGRVNENIGLTAVHHVFHAEHNRLVAHTKEVVLSDAQTLLDGGASQAEAVAFLNEWLTVDVAAVPASAAGLVWDGERLFQAAKFGTEMQYQHLVFEEFARKIQPAINTFLVPDGFDTTLNPSIVAEFAHVVYRFGHSMLTETIDKFDPTFTPDHISLIQGFLNPTAFDGVDHALTDDIAAGAIIRGMTRQPGNQIDEFVTSALRNNLLGLPLDLATINLARGRDTGVPSLNAARTEFYAASNQNILLKPYESWVDFAGHLKNDASIINFIAAYGTHETILNAATIEEKRDAAMALVGLPPTIAEAANISNASFDLDSLADGAPNVISTVIGNYTFTSPMGWEILGAGGLFAPSASVIDQAALAGANVVWLGQDGLLAKDTGLVLEGGVSYRLSFDVFDRLDLASQSGVARLVADDGTVLASADIGVAAVNGGSVEVMFQTAPIAAAQVGQGLRIEIQQIGGNGNQVQILVDDVR
ncbi:peroxidase family protein, partial [Bosea sp. Root381]|uniref:peroxidase family protein n=1 Tax=Bosea sp. Root381 TaxID=1736524 RepID=UPI00244EE154